MYCCDRPPRLDAQLRGGLLAVTLLAAAGASAEHLASIGVEGDPENSKAFALLASCATGSHGWMTVSAVRMSSDGQLLDLVLGLPVFLRRIAGDF